MKIFYHQPDGSTDAVDVNPGTSVMRAALSNGVAGIVGECGGQAMCATCHVHVHSAYLDQLPEMSEDEDEMLDVAATPRTERTRLGCQLKLGPGMPEIAVDVPESQEAW